MQNSSQESPYRVALRNSPPICSGSLVRFNSNVPGNTGEIIGHGAVYENNVFHHWTYTIIPMGMRAPNGFVLCTVERNDSAVSLTAS